MSTEEKRQRLSPHVRRLLILKLWLIEKFRFGERQVTLVWAAVICILGALVTECFRRATDLLHFLFSRTINRTFDISSRPVARREIDKRFIINRLSMLKKLAQELIKDS